jgi:hypothetical protein
LGADLGAVADRDRSEQLGAGADGDVVAERRVALAALEAGAAEGHALVERHAVADLGRLADHHAGAVVDEELAPIFAAGWISTRSPSGSVGDRARQQRHPGLEQRVGDAVGEQRLHPGPAGEDLEASRRPAPRGRGRARRRRRRAPRDSRFQPIHGEKKGRDM